MFLIGYMDFEYLIVESVGSSTMVPLGSTHYMFWTGYGVGCLHCCARCSYFRMNVHMDHCPTIILSVGIIFVEISWNLFICIGWLTCYETINGQQRNELSPTPLTK